MSVDYYFRDANKDRLYDSFNRQIDELRQMCLTTFSSLDVERDLVPLKESFCEEIKSSPLFKPREADYERFIIGTSTANHFYWRRDNGFDSLLSVQQFMEQNPCMVLNDEYDNPVSFDSFKKVVDVDHKVHRDYSSGDLIKSSFSSQIQSASARAGKPESNGSAPAKKRSPEL